MAETSDMVERYLRVHKKDISYIRYVFEGYEGIACATTIDPEKSIIKLLIAPDFLDLVDRILADLKHEITYTAIDDGEIG